MNHPALLLSRSKGAAPSSVSALTESWAAGSLDAAKWVFDADFNGAPGAVSASTFAISAGVLRISAGDTVAFNDDGRIRAVPTYSLLAGGGARVYARIGLPGPNTNRIQAAFYAGNGDDPDQGAENSYASTVLSEGTFLNLLSNQGTLAVDSSPVAYDPVAHAYWGISSDGTNIRWETAPDMGGAPGPWTAQTTAAILGNVQGWSLNKVRILFRRSNGSVALDAATDAPLDISNINIAPADPLFMLGSLF